MVILSSSPNPAVIYVIQNGTPNTIYNCPATVNMDNEKRLAVTANFIFKFLMFCVMYLERVNTRKVAVPPIGTSKNHIGDTKFTITTPKVIAMRYLLWNNAR